MSWTRCKSGLFHSVSFSLSSAAWAVLRLPEYWMSGWKDAIWPTSCSLSRVSMATLSSEWGHGSNWPIVSKLHFSEWFPQSCYWNRAPAPWWTHLVIHSLKGRRGKYKHDTRGCQGGFVGGGRRGLLASFKQRNYEMKKKWQRCSKFAWCTSTIRGQWRHTVQNNIPLPPPRPWALRSPVCPSHGSLNPSARVQVLTPALPPPGGPLRPARCLGVRPAAEQRR